MNRAEISIFVFGLYLAALGFLTILVPDELCQILGLKSAGETIWGRLNGLFMLFLAFFCIRAAREHQTAFIRWSLWTRPWVLIFLGACVLYGLEQPGILVFGVIDLAATIWSGIALHAPSETTCEVSWNPVSQSAGRPYKPADGPERR
jgi:hypothetical protein